MVDSKIKPSKEGPSDLLAIRFEDGEFRLETGKMTMSPSTRLSALVMLLNEVLFVLIENLSYGYDPERINQDLKFLDNARANELGNSVSIKVGPQKGVSINEEIWINFLTDILGNTLSLEQAIKSNTLVEDPPNIDEEDAKAHLIALLKEVDICAQLRRQKAEIARRGQSMLTLHDKIAEKNEEIRELRETVQRKDNQIKNIFGYIPQPPKKNKQKKPIDDFHGRDDKHLSTRHENELDAALFRLFFGRLRK